MISSRVTAALLVAGTVALGGCTGLSDTEQRVMTGGLAGAGAGAAIGAIAGSTPIGLGIGAATGIAGGYLWDQHRRAEDRAFRRGVEAGRTGN